MTAGNGSTLGGAVKEYLKHRRSLGFGLVLNEVVLRDFVRFATAHGHRGPLTTEFMLRWATINIEHSSSYQAERLSVVRGSTLPLRTQAEVGVAGHPLLADGRRAISSRSHHGAPEQTSRPFVLYGKELRGVSRVLPLAAAASVDSSDVPPSFPAKQRPVLTRSAPF